MTYDTVILNGMIVDGSRVPRYRGDIAIKGGRVAKIGRLKSGDGERTIDATGCIVAPGFVDLHTHYDAQVFWDPYCTLSGWHGVTSVVIGNCGFGFAPVRADERERAMLSMTRVEAIPLASMKAGLPWDWVTYPEFLDSVSRTKKAINILPYVPVGPLLAWVLGLEDAKAGREPTSSEMAELKSLLNEAMDAGGCGWSAQRLPTTGGIANQRDHDGTAMPSDNMSNNTALELARVLADRNEGFIQMTMASGNPAADGAHMVELAEVSGRPILFNVVQSNDFFPHRHRKQLEWLETCRLRGARVYGQAMTTAAGYSFTFEDWNLFDDADAWAEATVGTVAEKLEKLGDPARRPALREDEPTSVTGPIGDIVVLKCALPELQKYHDLLIREIAAEQGKHPVDAMLDIAVKDDLQTVFYAESFSNNLALLKEVVEYPYTIYGVSDGGAHTKFSTGGRYPTETLTRYVRDEKLISLEEAHWRLSAFPAFCAGFRDRGVIREGAPADVLVYDLDDLAIEDLEVVHDFPGGEWRRVQRARGYRHILVNGEVTLEDSKETGAMPGKLLRHGGD